MHGLFRRALPAVAALLAGCGADERMVRVAAERAPLLASADARTPAVDVLHAGDLVIAEAGSAGQLAWHGLVDGQPAMREGELVRVRRARGDRTLLAFRGDLGEARTIAPARHLCRHLGVPPAAAADCTARLRRIDLDGGTLAFTPCPDSTCRLGYERGRELRALELDGVEEVRAATVDGEPVALVRTRWTRRGPGGGASDGSSLVVLRVRGGFERALEVVTLANEQRGATRVERTGAAIVEGDGILFRGTRKVLDAATGKLLSATPLEEKYRLR